jgi:hypothetical protein
MSATSFGGKVTRSAMASVAFAMLCLTSGLGFGQTRAKRPDYRVAAFDAPAWGGAWILDWQPAVVPPPSQRQVTINAGRFGVINQRSGALWLAASPQAGANGRSAYPSSKTGLNNRNAPPVDNTDTFTNGGGTGLWSTSTNWTNGEPGGSSCAAPCDVLITGTGSAASVTEDVNATVNNLTLGSTDILKTNGNIQLAVAGTSISNGGAITISGGGGTNSYLFIDNSMTLSGAGTLTLSNTTSGGGGTNMYANNGAATLTNQSTIQGEGSVGASGSALTLVNSSGAIIDANSTAGPLSTVLYVAPTGGITNAGLLEATNSGVLQLQNTTINNAGGNITAAGSAAQVQLYSGTHIQGGTLNTTSGGTLGSFSSGVTLDGSTAAGAVTVSTGSTYTGEGNSQTTVLGTITNKGNIQLNGGGGTNTYLFIGGNTTLSGAGTLTLSNTIANSGATDLYATVASTLTNQSTIQGEGSIGANGSTFTLNNTSTGLINANSPGGNSGLSTALLVAPSGGITNAGLMEATSSGVLQLQNTTVNNSGGNITANGSAAQVQFYSGTDIQGGTLNTTNGGTLGSFNSGVTLDGTTNGTLTLSSGSTYTGEGNSQTTILGTINNKGNIQLNGGAGTNTYMFVGGNTTLQGGGTVTMNTPTANGGNTVIYNTVSGVTLTNTDNTIQGEGLLGDGQSLAIVNQSGGTINANSTAGTLNSTLTVQTTGGVTNTGLMEASNSGVLEIYGTTVNNASGTIKANTGATVDLDGNSTIQGGTLTANGGTLETGGGQTVTLDGSTSAGAVTINGTYTGQGNSQTHLLGTINNNGNILINNPGGQNTYLLLYANTTLQGTAGSTVTLSNTSSGGGGAYFYSNAGAVNLTNVNNVIQGEGDLGQGSAMTLINDVGGTINANSTGNPLTSTLLVQVAGSNGSPGVVNQGLMEATSSGALEIYATTVNNLGGNITANGSAATVELNSADIQGGTLNTLNGGTFENISNGTTLDGSTQGAITLNGTFTGAGNTQTILFGTLNNKGNLQLNGGGGTNTYLFINGNTTLQGTAGGTITLSDTTSGGGGTNIYSNVGADTLTNVNNIIQGEGDIGAGTAMSVVNQAGGIINANSTGGPLTTTLEFNPGVTATNQGLMEATNSGVLYITNATINNAGGNITANGATATVELQNADIQGGTLNNLNGATFETVGNTTTLDGSTQGAITVNGTFTLAGNSQSVLFGTFNNNGNIQLNGGGGTNTYGFVNANTTLQGNGSGLVTLNNVVSGGGNTFLYSNNGAVTLTNVNNTIEGAGVIGNGTALTVVNDAGGTFLANLSGQTLLLNGSAPVTNSGTFNAAAGSTLEVNTTLTNFTNTANGTLTGGTYNATGTIQFGSTGTSILADNANIILNGASAQLVNLGGQSLLTPLNSIGSGSSFSLQGGANFTTAGNFTNNGTLIVGASSTFDVNGSLTNISGTTISGGTYDLTGVLKANNATGIVTNAANITLTGTGALEDQSGANALVGLNDNASGAGFTINGGANFTTTGAFTNAGTLTVGSGSTFFATGNYNNTGGTTTVQSGGTFSGKGTVSSGTFTNGGILEATAGNTLDLQSSVANTGGTILATGSGADVLLDNTTITGGTLTTASGGTITTTNTPTLNGSSAITISSGSALSVANGQIVQATGTITNNGTVSLNSSGATTELRLTGNTTWGGTGTLSLSNNAGNLIAASAGTDALTNSSTIAGSGTISGLLVKNSGTIDANQSTALIVTPSAGSNTNSKTLEATAGGTLDLKGTWTNAGGTITATGAGSQVLLDSSKITGGTLTSASSGLLIAENGATISGLTISTGSTLDVNNAQTLNASGTITNNGTINLSSTGSNTELVFTAAADTLSGTGKLILGNNAANIVTATSANDVLTNSETIQGSGNIGNGNMGLVNNPGKSIIANQSTPLIIDTSSKGFNNKGTLSVSTGDTLQITGGSFLNFSGGTLTGGTYSVAGTLQYNSTTDITTNAATISLTGAAAKITDQNGNNALTGFTTNSSTGKLTLSTGQSLTDSAAAVTNAGTLTVGKNSKLLLSAATGTYTQSAGTTTVDGTLQAKGGITFNGGSVFGNGGTLSVGTNTVTDNATFNIGDQTMKPGKETIAGKYSQGSIGALNIDIGGTTAGTQYDQLTITSTASLNGVLNLDLINGFVPTLSETFDILNASSITGTFATINGTSINGSEHFGVVYNSNNVTLDVLSGPGGTPTWGGGGQLASNTLASGTNGGVAGTPEPGSLVLLGSGLLGLASFARRKIKTGRKS